MAEHPRPWRVDEDGWILDADGTPVYREIQHEGGHLGADAVPIILRAVNAHDALLSALKAVEWVDLGPPTGYDVHACPACWGQRSTGHYEDCPLAAALAAAEGREA